MQNQALLVPEPWLELVGSLLPGVQQVALYHQDQSQHWPVHGPIHTALTKLIALARDDIRQGPVHQYAAGCLQVVVTLADYSDWQLAVSIRTSATGVDSLIRLVQWQGRWLNELLAYRADGGSAPRLAAQVEQLLASTASDQLEALRHWLGASVAAKEAALALIWEAGGPGSLIQVPTTDQARLVQWLMAQPIGDLQPVVLTEQMELAPGADYCAVLTHRGEVLRLWFRLAQPLTPYELEQSRQRLQMALPILVRQHILTPQRWLHRLRQRFSALLQRRRMLGVAGGGVLMLSMLLPVNYHITIESMLEAQQEQRIAAPFDGYIRESFVKAGDQVRKHQVLARMDDQPLQIERIRTLSELQGLEKKYRQALALRDHAKANVHQAQIRQTQARLEHIDNQLAQTRLLAPLEGIIIRGDLSQQLGAPVEVGQLLFAVAPQHHYQVVLQVQEFDIRFIQTGLSGELKLAALPASAVPITITRLSPLFSATEQGIRYRVEARLLHTDPRLRPGMQGSSRVAVGRYPLGWVLLHHFIDWSRLQLWKLGL